MKFFTKLQITVVIACFLLSLVLLAVSGVYMYNSMQTQYQFFAGGIADTTAKLIDAGQFAELSETLDDGLPYYTELQSRLNVLYKGFNPKYLYTMIQRGEDRLVYIVDGMNTDDEDFSSIGTEDTLDNYEPELLEAFGGKSISTKILHSDQWGELLSAYEIGRASCRERV